MNIPEIIGLIALVFQLAVVVFVFPLSFRVTKSRFVAWILFAAFLSMFVLQFVMMFPEFDVIRTAWLTPYRDQIFGLFSSALLFAAMVFISKISANHRRAEEDLLDRLIGAFDYDPPHEDGSYG